jgi:hypothetical protein
VCPAPVLQVTNDDVYYVTPIVPLQNFMTPPRCTQTPLGNCTGGNGGTFNPRGGDILSVDSTKVLHPMMQPWPNIFPSPFSWRQTRAKTCERQEKDKLEAQEFREVQDILGALQEDRGGHWYSNVVRNKEDDDTVPAPESLRDHLSLESFQTWNIPHSNVLGGGTIGTPDENAV